MSFALDQAQTRALLRELERVDELNTGSVPAQHVDQCFSRAGLFSATEQNSALQMLEVDAAAGRAAYGKLKALTTTQQERVYQLLPQLRDSFNRFDLGQISQEKFRQELTGKLGLRETSSVQELFRLHAFDLTLHQLVQALNREDGITTNRAAHATSVLQQPVGVFAQNRTDDLSAHGNLASRSVRVVGHKPSLTFQEERDTHRRGGGHKGGGESLAFPEHIAASGSDMRQQVVAAVRCLDEGGLDSTRVFLRRLDELHVPLTPTLTRLVELQRLGTPIAFKDWLRAFEPFLSSSLTTTGTTPAAATPTTPFIGKAPSAASQQKGFMYSSPASVAASPSVNGRLFGEGLAGPDHPTKRTYDAQSHKSTSSILAASSPRPDLPPGQPAMLRAKPNTAATSSSFTPVSSSAPDFLYWSAEDQKRPPVDPHAVPIRRAQQHAASASIFDREATPAVNVVRKTLPGSTLAATRAQSAAMTSTSRTPFGTEADYAASFSNPKLTFG